MTNIILFLLGYFFFTLTLSKISEKEEIDGDGIAGFLILFPPIYLLYITKRFSLMIFITILSYGISNFLVMKGVPFKISLSVLIIPLLISFTYILYNLKADQKLNLLNLFPPVLGTLFLLLYLAFHHSSLEVEKEKEREIENKKAIENLKNRKRQNLERELLINTQNKNRDEKKTIFETLNKKLFKSFDNLNYNSINNDSHFGNS